MRAKIDLRKLPPLNALKGFEATSRRQSVRDAADELCLTHQAVSYQIQVLEDELGVALFSRGPMKVTLENKGAVKGVFDDPVPSLSDSKPLDCDWSAIAPSRITNPN